MKINKGILVLVIAIFMGSCVVGIGSASGSHPLIIDGDKVYVYPNYGMVYIHIDVPSSYGYDELIVESICSSNSPHVIYSYTAGWKIAKRLTDGIHSDRTMEKHQHHLVVSPGERILLSASGDNDRLITIWAYSSRTTSEPEPESRMRTSKPKPKSTSNTKYNVLSQKTVDVYLFNEDNDPLEVELYINGGSEGTYRVLSREWEECGSFKLPNDPYNEYVASWYEPDTGKYYEKRVGDQDKYWVKITLPAHDEEQVVSKPGIYTLPSSSDHEHIKASNELDKWIDMRFENFDVPISRELHELGKEMLTKLDIPRKDAEDIIDIAFSAHEEMENYEVVEIATVLAYSYKGDISEIRKTASELVEASSHKRIVPVPENIILEEIVIEQIIPESDYKASDILIPSIPEVTVEVGEAETIYFEIECRSNKMLQLMYLEEIDDISIATMDGYGKQYSCLSTFYPGKMHGETIHVRGRKEGTTMIDVSISEHQGTAVLTHTEIKVIVIPHGTLQPEEEEEEIYPIENAPLKITEDTGLIEAFGIMIIGGWRTLMDFFH